jgi:hypothetical protein
MLRLLSEHNHRVHKERKEKGASGDGEETGESSARPAPLKGVKFDFKDPDAGGSACIIQVSVDTRIELTLNNRMRPRWLSCAPIHLITDPLIQHSFCHA